MVQLYYLHAVCLLASKTEVYSFILIFDMAVFIYGIEVFIKKINLSQTLLIRHYVMTSCAVRYIKLVLPYPES